MSSSGGTEDHNHLPQMRASSLAVWATYGTLNDERSWAWRIPSILQLAIPVIALHAVLLMPESPGYLNSKGEHQKARQFMTRIHAGGDESSRLADFEMAEIEQALAVDSKLASSTFWMDLVSSQYDGNRHRALISVTFGVFSQWRGAGVVS